MNIHYTAEYLLNPTHPISINLIGCGGTGTQVLNGLARMNEALTKLGHKGIEVTIYDNDIITEANIGRQLFAEAEIGMSKAEAITLRINRFFGQAWEAVNRKFDIKKDHSANIIITCVDNIKTRMEIHRHYKTFRKKVFKSNSWSYRSLPYYWIDYGNTKTKGQAILSTLQQILQPKSQHNTFTFLEDIIDIYPKYRRIKENTEPSCSLAEALNKQDLFINSTLAQFGLALLWKLFREAYITYHGVFLNLETFKTNPILIK